MNSENKQNCIETIEKLRDRIPNLKTRNERATESGLVNPMLRALGWDIFDCTQVEHEYYAGQHNPGAVDIALMSDSKPIVFIEIKPVSTRLNKQHRNQLHDYCLLSKIDFSVLTNGQTWELFYYQFSSSEPIISVDIQSEDSSTVCEWLKKTLGREAVITGTAITAIQSRFMIYSFRRTLPDILANDAAFHRKFRLEIKKRFNFNPATKLVQNFLSEVAKELVDFSDQQGEIETKLKENAIENLETLAPISNTEKKLRPNYFELFGKRVEISKWREFPIKFPSVLVETCPEITIEKLLDLRTNRNKPRFYKSKEKPDAICVRRPVEVLPEIWITTQLSGDGCVDFCHKILEQLGYSRDELKIGYD